MKAKLGIAGLLVALVPVAVVTSSGPVAAGVSGSVVVTTTADELVVDGDCSLREAIETVNTGVGFDECTAGSSTIELPAGTIAFDFAELGPLVADTSMTLVGAGSDVSEVHALFFGTALRATSGVAITIEDLTVRGGIAVHMDAGAGLLQVIDGEIAGDYTAFSTVDSDVVIQGSVLQGGMFTNGETVDGDITVTDSTILGDNENSGLRSTNGSISIADSTLSSAVVQAPSLDIRRSYVGFCTECIPLRVYGGTLYLENSTVEIPLDWPAIAISTGTATIVSSTIYAGPGQPAIEVSGGGSATVTGSIIHCESATGLSSGGGNVTNAGCGFAGPGDVTGDPLLGPPTDNGGPTSTKTLLPGSPAIDNATTCPSVDQRGEPRPRDGDADGTATCDSGALELDGPPSPPPPPPPPPLTVTPVVGDWNGDGIDSPGVVSGNLWKLRDSLTTGGPDRQILLAGTSTGTPIVGDWDGDGDDDTGFVVQEANRIRWHLLTEPSTSFQPDIVFAYGRSGTPVVGDWNGDGTDDVGVVSGSTWFLRTSFAGGPADLIARFGTDGDVRIAGDWNGDGTDTVSIARGRTRFLTNTLAGGPADAAFNYGLVTDVALVGDWNGDGIDTPGIARSTVNGIAWHLRQSNTPGPAELTLRFGP